MRIPQPQRADSMHVESQAHDPFSQEISPSLITRALKETNKAGKRRRRLPNDSVVRLVVAMGLFRDRSIADVADALSLVLPDANGGTDVAPSTFTEARTRLGPEPVEWLFKQTGADWAGASAEANTWRGLTLFGMDGTTQRIADSRENRMHFGGPTSGRGVSGYPQFRLVALMALRSHILLDAAFGPYKVSEVVYATTLLQQIPDNSVTAQDRGFLGAAFLWALIGSGNNRHVLTRTKINTKLTEVRRLAKNDFIVELVVSKTARKKDPTLPETIQLRRIRYQRRGFRPEHVLTSLLDAEKYPAGELVALYHERWELELGFNEIKTEMLDREEAIRSRRPDLVEQEVWGILLAFNLIRREMEKTAADRGVKPICISFVKSLRLLRDEVICFAAAASGPASTSRRGRLRRNMKRFVLPPRRSDRSFKREVKIKMSKWPRKRPVTTGKAA